MSQRRRKNIRRIVESQYVSLCGPKPGSKAVMQKPKNTDSEHLLGGDLKKAVKKVKTSNMFKKSTNRHSTSSHSKFKFPSSKLQNQDFLYHGHKASSNNKKPPEDSTTRTAVQIARPRTSMYQQQGNRNFTANRLP